MKLSDARKIPMLRVKRLILGPAFTNTYLVWDDENNEGIVIDPADEGQLIIREIEKSGFSPSLIVITHGHFDHVGALRELKENLGIPAAIHPLEIEILKTVPFQAQLFGMYAEEPPTPEKRLTEGDTIKAGNYTFKIIETPGHSPGSISLYSQEAGIVFTGDTLFRRSIGRTDLPGGNFETLISSIKEKLFTLEDDVKVFPGHESPTTIGEEKRYNPFLQEGGTW